MRKYTLFILIIFTLLDLGCKKTTGDVFFVYKDFKVIGKNEDGKERFFITRKEKKVYEFLSVGGKTLTSAKHMNSFELCNLLKDRDGQILYEFKNDDKENNTNWYMIFDLCEKTGSVKDITPKCEIGVDPRYFSFKDIDGDGNSEILEELEPFEDILEELNGSRPTAIMVFSYDPTQNLYVPSGSKFKDFLIKDAQKWIKEGVLADGSLYHVLMVALPYWSVCDDKTAWKIFDDNYHAENKSTLRERLKEILIKQCFECNRK